MSISFCTLGAQKNFLIDTVLLGTNNNKKGEIIFHFALLYGSMEA